MRKTQRNTRQAIPETDAAARRAARRKRRIRRRIIRITIVMTIFLILLGLLTLLVMHITDTTPSVLAVKAVEVEGETRYSHEEIVEASGIAVGDSLLSIDKAQAHNNILARFPYLDYVDVGNSSFSTILIQVEEATVLGVVETEAGYMVMGDNNHALELLTDESAIPEGLVRVRGATTVNQTVGQTLLDERGVGVCNTLLTAAQQYGLSDLTLIDITERTNIRLMWKDQIQVVLGNESHLTLQVKALVGILPTLLSNNGEAATGRLDMSSYADDDSANDRAVFSPMSYEELMPMEPEEGATEPTDTTTKPTTDVGGSTQEATTPDEPAATAA